MNIKTIVILFLYVFSPGVAWAQDQISGLVLNAETRKPVDAATVTLHPKGSASILAYTMTSTVGTVH